MSHRPSARLRAYYQLTKPGIIYGNLMTATGGFLLASKGHVDGWRLLATLAGIAGIIAAACVCNNYLDRGLDAKMARTQKRALVSGDITGRDALLYAAVLGALGVAVLAAWTNLLTLSLGLGAWFCYVVLYGLAKRHSVHGTVVGSLPGAAPVVAGYTAVTGRLDLGAWLLFLILVTWQMPHFYAIATYRLKDYRAAGLPVLPVAKGLAQTKRQITLYIAAFTIACGLLTAGGYAGYTYLIVMVLLGLNWLRLALRGFRPDSNDSRWARQLFFFSLIIIMSFSLLLATTALLP